MIDKSLPQQPVSQVLGTAVPIMTMLTFKIALNNFLAFDCAFVLKLTSVFSVQQGWQKMSVAWFSQDKLSILVNITANVKLDVGVCI